MTVSKSTIGSLIALAVIFVGIPCALVSYEAKRTGMSFSAFIQRAIQRMGDSETTDAPSSDNKTTRGEKIDFRELKEPFIENIVATIDGLKATYKDLNQVDGHPYFEMMLFEEAIAMKYKRLMIDQMASFEHVDYEKDEEGRLQPVGSRQRKEFTAYLLCSVVTDIATHYVRSAQARFRMQQLICQRFAS